MIKKILIITDNLKEYVQIEKHLKAENHEIQRAKYNNQALATIALNTFDVVILVNSAKELLSSNSLITAMKEYLHYQPIIIALAKNEDSMQPIRSIFNIQGVDFCFEFPFNTNMQVELLQDVVQTSIDLKSNKTNQNRTASEYDLAKKIITPKFPAIGLAISTGGPKTIYEVFKDIPNNFEPPIFIVQHGPNWVIEEYAIKFKERFGLNAVIAENGQIIKKNMIYLAPNGLNMIIDKRTLTIQLLDSEKECFVKPSADPLFRSIARTFGQFSIAVVMTGMGMDGTKGALHIEAAGGMILAETPTTAIAPSMPRAITETITNFTLYNAHVMGIGIVDSAKIISEKLMQLKSKK